MEGSAIRVGIRKAMALGLAPCSVGDTVDAIT